MARILAVALVDQLQRIAEMDGGNLPDRRHRDTEQGEVRRVRLRERRECRRKR